MSPGRVREPRIFRGKHDPQATSLHEGLQRTEAGGGCATNHGPTLITSVAGQHLIAGEFMCCSLAE